MVASQASDRQKHLEVRNPRLNPLLQDLHQNGTIWPETRTRKAMKFLIWIPQSETIQIILNYQPKILTLSILHYEKWKLERRKVSSFLRLHSPLNKADPFWRWCCCSCRTRMGEKGWGRSPQQTELIVIRTFRSSALSQQPTQTPQRDNKQPICMHERCSHRFYPVTASCM